jgi:hypothetical protein
MGLKQDNKTDIASQVRLFRRATTLLHDPVDELQRVFLASDLNDLLSINIPLVDFSPFAVLVSNTTLPERANDRVSRGNSRVVSADTWAQTTDVGGSPSKPPDTPAARQRYATQPAVRGEAKQGVNSPLHLIEPHRHEAMQIKRKPFPVDTSSHQIQQTTKRFVSHKVIKNSSGDSSDGQTKESYAADQEDSISVSHQLVNAIVMIDEFADVLFNVGRVSHKKNPSLESLQSNTAAIGKIPISGEPSDRVNPQLAKMRDDYVQHTGRENNPQAVINDRLMFSTQQNLASRDPQSSLNYGMQQINTLVDEWIRQQKADTPTPRIPQGIGRNHSQNNSQDNPGLRDKNNTETSTITPNIIDWPKKTGADPGNPEASLSAQPATHTRINPLEPVMSNTPDMDKEAITRLVNEVLIEQARRHGVDLS